jgi:hypothetical protein
MRRVQNVNPVPYLSEGLAASSRGRNAAYCMAASGRRARIALLLITLIAAAGAACVCTPNKHQTHEQPFGCRELWAIVREGGEPDILWPRRGRSGRGWRAARGRKKWRSQYRQGASPLTDHDRPAAVMRALQRLLAAGEAVNERQSTFLFP